MPPICRQINELRWERPYPLITAGLIYQRRYYFLRWSAHVLRCSDADREGERSPGWYPSSIGIASNHNAVIPFYLPGEMNGMFSSSGMSGDIRTRSDEWGAE